VPPVSDLVREASGRADLPGGKSAEVLSVQAEAAVARELNLPLREIEISALREGVIPARYLRNLSTISQAGQIQLLSSLVSVAGLGGLGGLVTELLARIGVGRIRAADGDWFEDHNLNRQVLCTRETIGEAKADAWRRRCGDVNPAVAVEAVSTALDLREIPTFFDGAAVAVDALGGLAFRQDLQKGAAEAGIPLVTGASAGWAGYAAVVLPGARGPSDMMGLGPAAEDRLGVLGPTVALVASLMCAETVQLITTGTSALAGKMLVLDLRDMHFEQVRLG